MKDFSTLAQASKIIDDITQKSEILYKEDIKTSGRTVVEKITNYLEIFFDTLYECKAIEDHCLGNSFNVSIVNKKDYETFNKTKNMTHMFVLGLNIPLGGSRSFLTLEFRKNEPTKVLGDINDMTTILLVKAWDDLKEQILIHCENAIFRFNRECQHRVNLLAESQNLIKNFEV